MSERATQKKIKFMSEMYVKLFNALNAKKERILTIS